MSQRHSLVYETLADLKAAPTADQSFATLAGKLVFSDGLGGLYRFDASSTAADDATYLNVVQPTTGAGRWIRVIQRVRQLSNGLLEINGPVKRLYRQGTTTGTGGDVTLYLTDDNTASGTALFTSVIQISYEVLTASSGAASTMFGQRKSLSADLKTLVYTIARGNTTTLALVVGLAIPGLASVPAGTVVQFTIVGM